MYNKSIHSNISYSLTVDIDVSDAQAASE